MAALKDSIDDLLDKLNDDVFLEQLYERSIERYQSVPDPITPDLDARMYQRFARIPKTQHTHHTNQGIWRKCCRLAAACIVLFVITGYTILQVDAWRVQIDNLWLSFTHEREEPSIDASSELLDQIPFGTLIPAYIPEGYTLSAVDVGSVKTRLTYHNAFNLSLVYEVFSSDSTVFAQESQKESAIPILVQGHEGYLLSFGDVLTVIWHTDEHIFQISGTCTKEVLLKIANSTK